VKNRKDNQIDFENIKKISKEDFLKLKKHDCNPKQGDVLFSKDGTVGEVIKIDYEKEFIILSSWAILRPSNEIIQNYLYWFMRSPNAFNQAVNMKTGTAIRRIVLRNLKEVDIQFPESKKEQFSIVQSIEAKFSVIDKIEQVVNESLKKAEKLRKSILKSAFEGKLVKMEEVGK
jgi:restriction endonuclease S subunit